MAVAHVIYDHRSVMGDDYRSVIARVGPQAGAIAHLVRQGAEASLCGLPRNALGDYEDVDEPICPRCVEWLERVLRLS